MSPLRFMVLVGAFVLGACGDDAAADAAIDASLDAGTDAGRATRDGGPICATACTGLDLCCETESGPMCVDTITNPNHCGDCGVVCAEGRGTACVRSSCQCGRVEMGCLGTPTSWCCPPRTPGGSDYCANLMTAGRDCGACGAECDLTMASVCSAGTCLCGDERRACTGAADDVCCEDTVGMFSCRDTTTDYFHCGACGRSCGLEERCEGGTCTRGASCTTACAGAEVCCDGVCCDRALCDLGRCGVDGGV